MIKKRSPVFCFILSIITLGIYGIYWYVKLTNEVNSVSSVKGKSGGMSVFLTIITLGIYNYLWAYKKAYQLENAFLEKGVKKNISSNLFVILTFFGLQVIVLGLIQSSMNRLRRIRRGC